MEKTDELDQLTTEMVQELLKMPVAEIYQLHTEWRARVKADRPDEYTLLYIDALVNYVLTVKSAARGKNLKEVAM